MFPERTRLAAVDLHAQALALAVATVAAGAATFFVSHINLLSSDHYSTTIESIRKRVYFWRWPVLTRMRFFGL